MKEKKTKIKRDLFREIRSIKSDSKNTGITLIALVLTIVILLVLAGVVVNLGLGEKGLIAKAQTAVDKYKQASKNEQIEIARVENNIDSYLGSNRDISLTSLINKNDTNYNKIQNGYIIPIDSSWSTKNIVINLNDDISNYMYIYLTAGIITSSGNYVYDYTFVINPKTFNHRIFVIDCGDCYARFELSKQNNSTFNIDAANQTNNNFSNIKIISIEGIK